MKYTISYKFFYSNPKRSSHEVYNDLECANNWYTWFLASPNHSCVTKSW